MSAKENENSQVRPLILEDLPMVLEWRNHPQVRKVMFSGHEISQAEHLAWWESVSEDPSREVLIFSVDSVPIGVINFFEIDKLKKTCHWGFYLDSQKNLTTTQRLAVWMQLERAAIDYAFNQIGVKVLLCETFESNRHVHQLHRKFGFEVVENQVKEKEGKSETVIVMALKKTSTELSNKVPEQKKIKSENVLEFTFLGSANWDLVGREFEKLFLDVTGRDAVVRSIPFGQYQKQLWDDQSELMTSNSDYYIFCERFEDFFTSPFSVFDLSQRETFLERFDEYVVLIKAARKRMSGGFFVFDLSPVKPFSTSLLDDDQMGSVGAFIEEINEQLKNLCEKLPDCYLVKLTNLVRQHGAISADPQKFWHLARIPFSKGFLADLCKLLVKYILALRGESARVVVTDLDNTLWGGVIGDEGLDNIRLGGDYPGSAYIEVQKTLKALNNRGIALAICSKNTESVASEVFTLHPEMVLKISDFTSIRINWRDKVDNLREIAQEIGVGLSSLCFLDDSPYERAAVQQLLPEVIVPELPEDVTQWSSFILSHPYLATLSLTREDQIRIRQYESRARMKREEREFQSKEEYWKNLDMKLFISRLENWNKQRILQLLSKTNQFNMTTQRHAEVDLDRLQKEGADILAIGLSDKYSQREIIGALIFRPMEQKGSVFIDSFLLSCRVLGRDVENGVLSWASSYLKRKGKVELVGQFIETARNLPASQVYGDFGFTKKSSGYYHLDLKFDNRPIPSWFEVVEEVD